MKIHGWIGSFLILPVVLAASLVARAEDKRSEATVRDFFVCKSPGAPGKPGKTVRTLRVYESPEFGCRATYSKTNVEKVVGASRQASQCGSILDGIRKNLEASSWSCRRAGSASVIQSAEAKLSEAKLETKDAPKSDGGGDANRSAGEKTSIQ